MSRRPLSILNDPGVKRALAGAWQDSSPGLRGGHEEGGFVVADADGQLTVVRWPQGEQSNIRVPAHPGCRFGGGEVVATFHTHPDTGPEYLQEPSETDKRAVRDDADLKLPEYVGEFVVADGLIYLVTPGGLVRELGERAELLGAEI